MATSVRLVTTQFVAGGHAVESGGHAVDDHALVHRAGLKQGALACGPGAVPMAVTTQPARKRRQYGQSGERES
jgi:hypothetical protein